MSSQQVPKEPSVEDAIALFKAVEEKFPKALGEDKWYLVVLAALCGGGHPDFAATLYSELIKRPEYEASESRKALMRRLREALVKLVSIIGVCRPLDAIFEIEAVTKPEDKDYSFSREAWQADEANLHRGEAWLSRLYQHNLGAINDTFASQKDFGWISRNITYGLYLSDRTVLNDIETELVVLSGIMIQNLPRETRWHIRGSRRIGIEKADLEAVCECIALVAKFCDVSLHKVPTVEEVEKEV